MEREHDFYRRSRLTTQEYSKDRHLSKRWGPELKGQWDSSYPSSKESSYSTKLGKTPSTTYNLKRSRTTHPKHQVPSHAKKRKPSDEKIERFLSLVLRHTPPADCRVRIDSEGFVLLPELLEYSSMVGVTLNDVKRVVFNCLKQRFQVVSQANGTWKIRAIEGHTIDMPELELFEITSASELERVLHSTTALAWQKIRTTGLSKMKRQYIHFSVSEPDDNNIVISGMRSISEVVISIDIEICMQNGLKFFKARKGVILCQGNEDGIIPPWGFKEVYERKSLKQLNFTLESPIPESTALLSNPIPKALRDKRKRRVVRRKAGKVSYSCPIEGCSARTQKLKRHVLGVHVSRKLWEPTNDMDFSVMAPVYISGLEDLVVMAEGLDSVEMSDSIYEEVVEWINGQGNIPLSSIITSQAYFRLMNFLCNEYRHEGFIPPENDLFLLNPINSKACLVHWRALVPLLNKITASERRSLIERDSTEETRDEVWSKRYGGRIEEVEHGLAEEEEEGVIRPVLASLGMGQLSESE